MRDDSPNYGIQQSGGQSIVGNQAVGPGAKAVSRDIRLASGPSGETTERLLETVQELLERHRAELPGTTKATAEILREELNRPEPDRGVLGRLLERLTTLVKPVPPLVTAVTQLSEAIHGALS